MEVLSNLAVSGICERTKIDRQPEGFRDTLGRSGPHQGTYC